MNRNALIQALKLLIFLSKLVILSNRFCKLDIKFCERKSIVLDKNKNINDLVATN